MRIVRRRSTGERKQKRKSVPVFQQDLLVKFKGPSGKVLSGTVKNYGKHTAVIKVRLSGVAEKPSRRGGTTQMRVSRTRFLKVPIGGIVPHKPVVPEMARRPKRVDVVSKKMAKLGLLYVQRRRLWRTRKVDGGKRLGQASFKKARIELDKKIEKLRLELKKSGP